jgi:hypothetical protein
MGVLIRAIVSCIPLITISTGKICTDLLNYISDTVNISYSLIDAVCFIASNQDDDSSGDNSGDIPTTSGRNICDFNCTDYSVNCKPLAQYIYNTVYYIGEEMEWLPEQFEKVCLDWHGSNITAPVITNNTNTTSVATGVLMTFGIVFAGVVVTIAKICFAKARH